MGPPRKRILFLVLALCVARPGSLGASCSVSSSLSSAQRRGEMRLRGGLGLRGEDVSLQGASADDSTAGMRGAASPAGTGASEQTTEARKRQRRRGPKGEHPAKRKHRGRRGGKHAKEAREKRLAVPLDPQTLDGIQTLATTLAEISAAAPHAAEEDGPGAEADPVMRYLVPEKTDALDDVRRTSIYDERGDLEAVGPEFALRMCGPGAPRAWRRLWFQAEGQGMHGACTAAAGGGEGTAGAVADEEALLPAWARRRLVDAGQVGLERGGFAAGLCARTS